MRNWGRWAVVIVPVLLAAGGIARLNAQGAVERSTAADPEGAIGLVRDATLGAVREVPVDGSVADFEASILFALDNIQQSEDIVDKGLAAAYDATSVPNARQAIANIRALKLRAIGTSAIPGGLGSAVSFGGGAGSSAGGGGGGTGNYSS